MGGCFGKTWSNHIATWISSIVSDLDSDQPTISPNDIIQTIRINHGVSVPYETACNAKENAKNEIQGSGGKWHAILKSYLGKLESGIRLDTSNLRK